MRTRSRRMRVLRWLPSAWLMTRGSSTGKNLYLSFDDGPHPEHTPRLLDLLAEHDAKATFFLIGQQIERHPDIARRIAAEGHALGNHSYSHPQFEQLSLDEQIDQIRKTDTLLSSIDGHAEHMFRPPRGVLPLPMVLRCMKERRQICVWSYDTHDYSRRSMDELLPLIRRNPVRSNDILLMHDDGGVATDLLGVLLPEWRGQGFAFQALPYKS